MSHIGGSFDDTETAPSNEEMESLMTEKAHELFKVCDMEEKGFITKRDMQRLQSELPLSPDQLEHVFDSLDDDGNGYLTLEEFTDGFGSFLGLKPPSNNKQTEEMDDSYIENNVDTVEDEHNFKHMMENLGANNLFEDESTVQALWCRLRRDDPDLATNFEDFVYKISNEIRKSKVDFDTLEGALRSKTSAHDEEVRKLYEEMEIQIKQEKEKVRNEERIRERQLRDAMEAELLEKDKQLQELLSKHTEMEERLGFLNTVETETKIENEKLAKEKEDLEEMLIKSQSKVEESQSYIDQLQQQNKNEKRERARAAIQLSEGIAVERETLVKQLDMLKTMNRKLQDEKDEAEIRRDNSFQNVSNISMELEMEASSPCKASPRRGELERQGSTLSKYFNPQRISKLSSRSESISEDVERGDNHILTDIDDGIECDDDVYIDGQSPTFIHHSVDSFTHSNHSNQILHSSPWRQMRNEPKIATGNDLDLDSNDGSGNNENTTLHEGVRKRTSTVTDNLGNVVMATTAVSSFAKLKESGSSSYSPDSTRGQPVGADELTDSGILSGLETPALQRVFKVVFVGDSGVGKSSFIHRFCTNFFKATYAATIGVDFQIRNLNIEGQVIVLQLWDTAGQERFRSITKQYFRKADGVIIMYDVTSETSFTNVRNWMTSVKEGVSDDAVLVLLGNKNDLVEDDSDKAVKVKDGSRLADEYGTLFYETSACNGDNVNESMEGLARVLKDKEDVLIEKSFRLEDSPKKKGCCS
ncbi:Calcium release activated channel regulator [Mactra antiquata]